MVVHIILAALEWTDRKSIHVDVLRPLSILTNISGRSWQVIDDPIHRVVSVNTTPENVLGHLAELLLAQHLACLIDFHLDLVRRVLDCIAPKNLPEILHTLLNRVGLTIRKCVIPKG